MLRSIKPIFKTTRITQRFGSGQVHGNEPGGYFLGLKVVYCNVSLGANFTNGKRFGLSDSMDHSQFILDWNIILQRLRIVI
jgi:hypothetical protein